MASVKVTYTWPGGCALKVSIRAKVNNPEALTAMRIEAKRLWHEAMVEMRADDLAHGEVAAPDA